MDFLKSPKARKIASICVATASVLVLCVVIAMRTVFAETSLEDLSKRRYGIDGETRKPYPDLYVEVGSSVPWKNPDTGKNTLFPAELCYWTRDGKAKMDPTPVLLNEYIGKKEKTICPDCGHVVVSHNPMPPMELMMEAARREGKLKDDAK